MNWASFWRRLSSDPITVYADFIDPFCYVGFHNLRKAAESASIELLWHGFELNPDTPETGSLRQTAYNSDLQPGMWASVRDFARKSGLLLEEPDRIPNTRLAHLWIQSVSKSDVKNSLIERIYQAYLSDKMDIGNPQILKQLALELHLPEKPLEDLAQNRAPERLEQFRKEAIRLKFPGMPGFVYRGKTSFGALSENDWNKMIEEKVHV